MKMKKSNQCCTCMCMCVQFCKDVDQRVIHQRVTLQNQTRKKKLVMATNAEFPPFEYYDGDEVVGIDAEFAAKESLTSLEWI